MKRVYPGWNVRNNEPLTLKDHEPLQEERDGLEEFFPRCMNEPELPVDHEFGFDEPKL